MLPTQNASDTKSFSGCSPKNRIKFLCSHGGKILPRPSDGKLKYFGGETRVISVPSDISFQELMKKLTYLIDGKMILKYQVASEDLDALVTVKCDEDVRYMHDEIKNAGITSRLRAFLFQENPTASSSVDAIEQRYIDAINGIPTPKHHHSASSSPTSPDTEAVNEAIFVQRNNYHHNGGRMMSMHRVRSSPNISTMSTHNVAPQAQQTHHLLHQQHNGGRMMSMHRVRSSPNISTMSTPPQAQQTHHLLHQQPQGGFIHHHYPQSSLKPPTDLQRSERRLISVRSVGRADGVRYQFPHYHAAMHNRGGGNGLLHYQDCLHFSDTTGNRPLPSTYRLTRDANLLPL